MKRNGYDYEEQDLTEGMDDIKGVDIKINPDFYVHNLLIKAQDALMDENLSNGMYRYRLLVEQIEILANSARMLGEEYKTELESFKQENKELREKETKKYVFLEASKKMELLTKSIFIAKGVTDALKVRNKDLNSIEEDED